jgi:hypothetical protein
MTDDPSLTTRDLAGRQPDAGDRDRAHEGGTGREQPPKEEPGGLATESDQPPVRAEEPVAKDGEGDVMTAEEPSDEPEDGGMRSGGEPLLPADQMERFSGRWQKIQADFVDRPRESVEAADALVADLMQRLAASFSNERERLEGQWDKGDDVSTENLRIVLTRYRSFFDRLLAA